MPLLPAYASAGKGEAMLCSYYFQLMVGNMTSADYVPGISRH